MRCVFFFQAEDGIRDYDVTGVQTCALPIFTLRIAVFVASEISFTSPTHTHFMRREAFFPFLVLILLFGSVWVLQSNEKYPVIGPTTGCTDSTAENYNPSADVDDGFCTYSSQPSLGCTDSAATNYVPTATEDDGSCTYPPQPVQGCTNSSATNYDPAATEDDGSDRKSVV